MARTALTYIATEHDLTREEMLEIAGGQYSSRKGMSTTKEHTMTTNATRTRGGASAVGGDCILTSAV